MTGFAFSVLITVVMTGIIYLWARRRAPGAPLTWGEAFVGGLFLFTYFVVIYGVQIGRAHV